MRLETAPPFDGPGLLRFFADHAIAGLEGGDHTRYSRGVRLPGGPATIDIRLDGPHSITLDANLADAADLPELVRRVRRLFDLDVDAAAIDAALARDPTLAPSVLANPGVRLPGSVDAQETLIRTLLGQQVSVPAARTVLGRVCRELGGGADGLFPTADAFGQRGHEVLRGPARRVASIIGIAGALASGDLVVDETLSVDELTHRLVAMPGIGPWTAGYVAMRVLGAPDVLLAGDLIMLQSADALGLPSTEKTLGAHGARWSPWRSYAGLHLWRSIGR